MQVFLDLCFKRGEQDLSAFVIFSLQIRYEFISADPEDRAVFELLADQHASVPDIFISGFMPSGVVHIFQAVQIKDDHAEFLDITVSNTLIHLLFHFDIGVLVLYAGEGIRISHMLG